MVVVWLFARLAGHVLSAVALPLSVIPAFIGMQWLGFFHQRDHAAGAVAGGGHSGGRRHRRGREHRAPPAHGQTPYQAAMEAADEIGLAVVATTFTLIAVFCPPHS